MGSLYFQTFAELIGSLLHYTPFHWFCYIQTFQYAILQQFCSWVIIFHTLGPVYGFISTFC